MKLKCKHCGNKISRSDWIYYGRRCFDCLNRPDENSIEIAKCKTGGKELELGKLSKEFKSDKSEFSIPYWEDFGYCRIACWTFHVEKELQKLNKIRKKLTNEKTKKNN